MRDGDNNDFLLLDGVKNVVRKVMNHFFADAEVYALCRERKFNNERNCFWTSTINAIPTPGASLS